MSADIQTRKRKDKKRRKEDESTPFQPTIPIITNNHSANDDVNIHVHKEGGLGGGICAKLVFFVLFSALAVLIGLIITEHRGLTDVDVVDTNSKFSQMFEGWTDSGVDHHEDDLEEIEHVLSEEHDDHDEEEEPEADTSEPENEEEHEHSDEDADKDEDVDTDEDQDRDENDVEDENTDNDEEDDDDSAENEDNEDETQLSQEQTSTEQYKEEEETYESNEDVKESEENEDDEDTEKNFSTEKSTEDKSEEHEDESDEKEDEDELDDEHDELDKTEYELDNDENIDDGDKYDEDEKEDSAEDNVSEERDEMNKSDEDEKSLDENLSEEKQVDGDSDDEDDDERFVRKASKEVSKEEERDVDDEEAGELLKDKDDQNEPDVSATREPDDNVQESSGSPSKLVNEVGEATGGVTKNITNTEQKIRQEIDDAHDAINYNPAYAVKLFDKILEKSPSSPRSIYGKALALNQLADQKRSNEILYQAIQLYTNLLKMPDVPDDLYKEAADRTIKVMRFVGQYKNIIEVHKLAINRFPENTKYYNELVVTYLTINRIQEARPVLKQILKKWPNDGFALVHQGFILKIADNNLEEAADYLKRGIATNHTGVIDGRFYFHLGDALERLGKHDEAMQVYEEGTKNKVFLSKYQRSLYNVQRLTGKPFWEENDLPYLDLFRALKQHWRIIRDEGLSALNEKGYFQDESENLRDTGEWKQFELFARGRKNAKNCAKSPITCSLIEKIPDAKGCKRGQTKFSVMHPGTHVWPHCGPTNCRLRVHLGLKVPPKTFLRVADEIRSWQEGNVIIFDDSFEHEVWHNGTEFRLVLIVDVWHPELSATEKRNLSPI